MRHVFSTMGTVASVEAPDGARGVLPELERVFIDAEQRFSLYRDESELSRIGRRELSLMDSSDELRDAYASALSWRHLTGGAFTPNRPDGVVDLNGIVKAQATDAAARLLVGAGFTDWSINVGGDVLVSGAKPDGTPWTVGIVDPADRSRLACSIALHDGRRAVATSGSAERGDHIWLGGDRHTAEFVQVTVVANDIVMADVLATAIVSGGHPTLDDLTERFSVDVFTVDRDGDMLATPGLRVALLR